MMVCCTCHHASAGPLPQTVTVFLDDLAAKAGQLEDLRLKIGDRRLYFETVLMTDEPDDPDDPIVIVVSVHDV